MHVSALHREAINTAQTSAMWYVWGRNDAGDHRVNALKFAEEYVLMKRNLLEGRITYLPSIQDHYNTVAARTEPSTEATS